MNRATPAMPKTKKLHIPSKPSEIARRIDPSPVHDEMRDSFMPYALSVTTARAIPDVRDGLKPVQRRILFAMNALGLRPGEPFRKSAAVVGEVMGKYHPHGDSAIYEAMVRMGQPFSMSLTLVEPKGNFGSLDDPPAAYRYTEARLTNGAITLVSEIGEDTVELVPNFDGERMEPTCLPAVLPNLLINGASGIAVGMATSMAPHNLGEVAAAIKLVLAKQRPKPTVDELMKHLPAPDFPGGALVVVDDALRSAYETGKGSVRVRARAEVEHATAKRERIVVTELPYMVGPERVLKKIRELIQAGKLPSVSSVDDLSDRHSGLRLVVECRPGASGRTVLSDLYRLTPLEDNFSINNVALVNDVPTTLSLYELCQHYVSHRLDVIVRRTIFRLDHARQRSHIVEGLLIALDQIDVVIAIIRNSPDVAKARKELISRLSITELQAEHILDLMLRRLTGLEASKLEAELTELTNAINGYEVLLKSKTRQRTLVSKELDELVKNFAVPRRSSLLTLDDLAAFDELAKADSAHSKETAFTNGSAISASVADNGKAVVGAGDITTTVIALSTSGLLGRRGPDNPLSAKPGRHDLLQATLETSTLDVVYAVTDTGRLLSVAANSIPEMARGSRGASVTEMFSLSRGEKIVGLLAASDAIFQPLRSMVDSSMAGKTASDETNESLPIALVTLRGQIKRTERSALSSRRRVSSLINLSDGDKVMAAFDAPDDTDLVMIASDGQVLRTEARAIPVRGHGAMPVAGMKLKGDAVVVAAGLAAFGARAVLITDAGAIKITDLSDLKSFGRGAGGVTAIKLRGDQTKPPENAVLGAWIGRAESVVALVSPGGSAEPANLHPLELLHATTAPKKPASELKDEESDALLRVLAVGEYRFG